VNADELAAVIAAAQLVRLRAIPPAPAENGSRWALAARARVTDAMRARLLSRAASRWAVSERLRE